MKDIVFFDTSFIAENYFAPLSRVKVTRGQTFWLTAKGSRFTIIHDGV